MRTPLVAVAVTALLVTDAGATSGPVGHSVKRIAVSGTAVGELRSVDVHLWYPADAADAAAKPRAVYRSALHGAPLPAPWDPLAWSLESDFAREGAAVEATAKPFQVLVFSPGSVNDPLNNATMLELIAGAGFVVAAPSHVTDTQDDVRIDYLNAQAEKRVFKCNDGLPDRPIPVLPAVNGDCSRPLAGAAITPRMVDRSRDISAVLDALPGWFGTRADMAKVGVLGHSRGTLSGLVAAGGSTTWGIAREPRVRAVMGMASAGARAVALQPNLSDIRIPTLLVAGGRDQNSPLAVNQAAHDAIGSADKTFLLLPNAHHRTFLSTFCDQLQAAGAITQENSRAILDAHTFNAVLTNDLSGNAVDYCTFASFTSPVDIRPLVALRTGFNVTAQNVPATGLSQETVTEQMADLAVEFFTTKLARAAGGDVSATVPATLSLSLGTPASFGAFTPGVDRTYEASMTANVISTASDATLSVADPSPVFPGRFVNGAFALAETVRVRANAAAFGPLGNLLTYSAPISNDTVTIDFQQHIGPNEALRTGAYSKTLTFTLSTTSP